MKMKPTDLPLFELYLKERKRMTNMTIYSYKMSIKRFLSENPDIDVLEDYNNFLIKVMIHKRCNHYYSALKNFIEYKITDSSLKKKLIDNLLRPKERNDIVRTRQNLSEEKIIEIISNIQEKKHMVIALIQTQTGARVGDVMRLKRGNIYFEDYEKESVVRLNLKGKGGKQYVVTLFDKGTQDIVIDFTNENFFKTEYYFLELGKMKNRTGNQFDEPSLYKMNYQWYWADLKQALQTSGVDKDVFATHDFRRCYARRFWEKYKDINALQRQLKHRDPKVTLKYLEQSGLDTIDYDREMQK